MKCNDTSTERDASCEAGNRGRMPGGGIHGAGARRNHIVQIGN